MEDRLKKRVIGQDEGIPPCERLEESPFGPPGSQQAIGSFIFLRAYRSR